jgi:hypothetical protein
VVVVIQVTVVSIDPPPPRWVSRISLGRFLDPSGEVVESVTTFMTIACQPCESGVMRAVTYEMGIRSVSRSLRSPISERPIPPLDKPFFDSLGNRSVKAIQSAKPPSES